MFKSIAAMALAACLALAPGLASAHDYWVMPQTFHPQPDVILPVSFEMGHSYFKGEGTPDITKFRMFMAAPGGARTPLAYTRADASGARAEAPIMGPGTYVIGAVSTEPEYWSRTPKGYQPGRADQVKGAVHTGKYIKSTKTILTVGRPSDSFGVVLGLPIEIIPPTNPARRKAGETLALKVLFRGAPAAGVPVTALYEGYKPAQHGDAPEKTETDARGLARVKIARPGKWLVYGKREITPPAGDADLENYRGYLLFNVDK